MGKNKNKDVELEVTENAEVGTDAVEGGEDTPKKKGGKNIVLTLADGTTEARVDYCRRRYYDEGATRGEIAKELCDLQGKNVPYQIVFQACKETSETDKTRKADKLTAAEAAATAKADTADTADTAEAEDATEAVVEVA